MTLKDDLPRKTRRARYNFTSPNHQPPSLVMIGVTASNDNIVLVTHPGAHSGGAFDIVLKIF